MKKKLKILSREQTLEDFRDYSGESHPLKEPPFKFLPVKHGTLHKK